MPDIVAGGQGNSSSGGSGSTLVDVLLAQLISKGMNGTQNGEVKKAI